MQVIANVGGKPGDDCNGFCKYCYFRKVNDIKTFGCAHCLPNRIGCEQCTKGVAESGSEFRNPFEVLTEVQNTIMMQPDKSNIKANISGGGDVSCYPYLEQLISNLNDLSLNSHLGYTSGKGINDDTLANRLINHGVNEVTFTIFANDIDLRKNWVRDPNPEASLKACQTFAENIKLIAASVIIPGVNDGEILRQTCNSLEEWGVEGMILMRFANTFNEGLILGNEPILKNQESQPLSEFEELVREINKNYNFRVSGTPVCDPTTGGPFAIANNENEVFLQFIKPITGEASLITSKTAEPYLSKIFSKIEAPDVNIIPVEKEIACLITKEDLETIDLGNLYDTVLIPGRAFVHQLDAEKILCADGVNRLIARGPDTLSIDGELSNDLTDEDLIETELEQFNELADAINFFGMKVKK